MDFAGLLRFLRRRWWIALLGFVLSAGAAAGVYGITPPTYEVASQAIVLLPPTASLTTEDDTSPFLNLPSGLLVLARVVTVIPGSPDFREAMEREGYETTYTVELDTDSPIVTFFVEGDTSESVLRTRDELMLRFAEELDRIQAEQNVPDRQFAHVQVLEASSSAEPVSRDRLRSAALAGVAGAVLTLVVLILADLRGKVTASRSRDDKSPQTV